MSGRLYKRARNKFGQVIDALTLGPTRRKLQACFLRLDELVASMATLQREVKRLDELVASTATLQHEVKRLDELVASMATLQHEVKRIQVKQQISLGRAMPLIVVDSISQDDVLLFFGNSRPSRPMVTRKFGWETTGMADIFF